MEKIIRSGKNLGEILCIFSDTIKNTFINKLDDNFLKYLIRNVDDLKAIYGLLPEPISNEDCIERTQGLDVEDVGIASLVRDGFFAVKQLDAITSRQEESNEKTSSFNSKF